MTEVCNVLDITREAVRLWKNHLRKEGLKGMLTPFVNFLKA